MCLVLGVTGGIASGKSTFTKKLLEFLPAQTFNADAVARALLEKDAGIRRKVEVAFPQAVVDGNIDREKMRELVFSHPEKRRILEALLHPVIRQQWIDLAKKARSEGKRLIVDIPLLFETGSEKYFDATVIVGCDQSTQIQRLKIQRNIEASMAQSIIEAQMGLIQKITRADFVIWNESTTEHLATQAKLFTGYLKHRYG